MWDCFKKFYFPIYLYLASIVPLLPYLPGSPEASAASEITNASKIFVRKIIFKKNNLYSDQSVIHIWRDLILQLALIYMNNEELNPLSF